MAVNMLQIVVLDSPSSTSGASVLLVDRDAKSFIAIAAPADLVEQRHSSNRA